MTRFLLILISFSIIDRSIDLDYTFSDIPYQTAAADYDDIDSITEYLLEKIMDDDHFTSEEDDDTGSAQNKGVEKCSYGPLYCQIVQKPVTIPSTHKDYLLAGLDQANRTCKGYSNIYTPPPDILLALVA
jgi:hypothetical protein